MTLEGIWLCAHGRRLLLAEFDAPAFSTDLGLDRVNNLWKPTARA